MPSCLSCGHCCEAPSHRFWPDDISLIDSRHVNSARLLTTAQITDTYLLALAHAHGGRLATFDRRLLTSAVPNGEDSLAIID